MSSRRGPRALDDRELIAAILARIGGGRPLAPGKLAGALEADGLRLELEGTITRAPARDKIAEYRAAALAELAKSPHLANHCGAYTQRRGDSFSGKGGGPCESKTIVAVLVLVNGWRGDVQFKYVCGRHLEAHGYGLANVLGVVPIARYQLEGPRRRAAEEAAAAGRRRREEEAEIARRAVAEFTCRTCGAAPGDKCRPPNPRNGSEPLSHPHYDRCHAAEERIREERRKAAAAAS